MTDARWGEYREARDAMEAGIRDKATGWVGRLKERELVIAGAVAYWCEGSKSKPWREQPVLEFINSDPGLIEIFLRFVEAMGADRRRLTYRLSIHESADASAAGRWWAERIGIDVADMRRPTIKKHKPTGNRRNKGDEYRGCLVITVPRSRRLYVRVEGLMAGIFASLAPR